MRTPRPGRPLVALLLSTVLYAAVAGCGTENAIAGRVTGDGPSSPTVDPTVSASASPGASAEAATDRLVLGSDEGAFVLRGSMRITRDGDFDSTLLGIGLEWGGDVLVMTGSQFGPFELRTRVLESAPPVGRAWEDVDELSLEVGAGGVVATELVNNDPSIALVTEPGTYRVRVSARDRMSDDQRARRGLFDEDGYDDETPVETYLLEAWPADPAPPEVLRETSVQAAEVRRGPEPEPVIEGQDAGLAGAAKIGRDADGRTGARELSGEVGSLEVSRTFPTTADDLYEYLRFGPTLSQHVPSWSYLAGSAVEDVGLAGYSAAGDDHPDQLSGPRGLIRNVITSEDAPLRREQEWAWLAPDAAGSQRVEDRVLVADTTLSTTYDESTGADGEPRTVVTVRHDDVPVEWVDDLRAWWRYQLAFMQWYADRY